MPTLLWVAPGKVLGGNVGFGAIVPFGRKESTTDLGDPLANALIGWHEGNWHWNIGTLLNIPIGPWSKQSDTNIAFHHWGLDTTAAVTWLDPSPSSAPTFTADGQM